jgi:hypothetical protein
MSARPIEVMCGHDDLRIPLTGVPFPSPKYGRWRHKTLEGVAGSFAKAGLLPSLLPSNRGCFMRNHDLVSDSFLTLTAVGLVMLCSSLLAFAFT